MLCSAVNHTRFDVSDHHSRRIAAPTTRIQEAGSRVFEQGPRVGWAVILKSGDAYHVDSFLRARPASKVVALSGALTGLSSRGALLATGVNAVDLSAGSVVGAPVRIRLRADTGQTETLLSSRGFVSAPQLLGATLAWAGVDGSVRVARVAQ